MSTIASSCYVILPRNHRCSGIFFSQIKGIRSANDQTFTCSSWSSRSWLIIRGAQPAVQQQLGLDALKRLYEAKGFDPHLLRDVRRRLETKSACCLVAVLLVVFTCDCLSERFVVSFMYLHAVGSEVLALAWRRPLLGTWRSMSLAAYYAQTARPKPRAK